MKPTDEQISAWLDGALPPADAERFAAALQQDKDLRDRIEAMSSIDGLVRKAIPLDETVPDDLLDRLGLQHSSVPDNVIALVSHGKIVGVSAPDRRHRSVRLVDWRIAAQVALVACLGVAGAVWLSPASDKPEASYRALSADGVSSGIDDNASALVLFDDTVNAEAARQIAESLGARFSGDQTASGAWMLLVDPEKKDYVLETLRQRDDVIVAEAINGG
ncbi:MAG: hypothetical protein KDE55_16750 [Novosphingobium sp.]|nr:hypothetical protein [Novosphingobium sp.]